jgi:hypothetical protein
MFHWAVNINSCVWIILPSNHHAATVLSTDTTMAGQSLGVTGHCNIMNDSLCSRT